MLQSCINHSFRVTQHAAYLIFSSPVQYASVYKSSLLPLPFSSCLQWNIHVLLELVSLLSPVRSSVQGVISLVVDDVTMVTDEVVHSEASEENAKEVKRQRPRLLRLSVVSSQHWSRCLGLFLYSENRERERERASASIVFRHRYTAVAEKLIA
jgi:hypothetical protein